MPRAITVWLVDNTTLTFQQIAEFTGLHLLEVKAFADGDVGANIRPMDPVQTGLLASQEIDRCQKDEAATLQMLQNSARKFDSLRKKRAPYTPISKRAAKPNAIAWLLKNHPEIQDAQIIKLLGTTRTTIDNVRHNSEYRAEKANDPKNPVELGLCTSSALDSILDSATKTKE